MNRKNKKKSFNDLQEAAWHQNQERESSQASPEFSPILYWREPIPEVEIVDLDPQPSTSKNIKKESKGKSKEQTKIYPLGKIMQQKEYNISIFIILDQNEWPNKQQCNDAEKRYHEKEATKTKNTKVDKKCSAPSPKTVISPSVTDDDRTLEEHLEGFKNDNSELKKNLLKLTEIVGKLQERVLNLENNSIEVKIIIELITRKYES